MSVTDFIEEIEQLTILPEPLPELIPELPEPEMVVKESREDVRAKPENRKKVEKHRILRVRDSQDSEGDLIFHLHLETYDRRLLDDLAERYGLTLVFVTEYRDYEREEWTQDAA